jgi:hypothetical protein
MTLKDVGRREEAHIMFQMDFLRACIGESTFTIGASLNPTLSEECIHDAY